MNKFKFIFIIILFFTCKFYGRPGYKKFKLGMKKNLVYKTIAELNHSKFIEKYLKNGSSKISITDNDYNCAVLLETDKNKVLISIDIIFENIPEKAEKNTKKDFFKYLKKILDKKYGKGMSIFANSIFTYKWFYKNKYQITLSAFLFINTIHLTYKNFNRTAKQTLKPEVKGIKEKINKHEFEKNF